jgi:hypothetical protein
MGVSTLGRHGKGSTMFPADETGAYMSSFPANEVKVFNSDPHWLKGYPEVTRRIIAESQAGLEGGQTYKTIYPQVITNPTTGLKQYGNTTLMDYVNLPVKRGLNSSYADASLLPEDQIPYLLPKEELVKRYPWQYMSKDQEIKKLKEKIEELLFIKDFQQDMIVEFENLTGQELSKKFLPEHLSNEIQRKKKKLSK